MLEKQQQFMENEKDVEEHQDKPRSEMQLSKSIMLSILLYSAEL